MIRRCVVIAQLFPSLPSLLSHSPSSTTSVVPLKSLEKQHSSDQPVSVSSLAFFFSLSHLYMCSALGFVRWVFYLESSQSPIEMNEKQKKQKTCFRAAWMNGCDAMWASCLSHTHDIYAAHALSFERGLVFFFKVYNAFSGCEFVSFTSVHCVRASNILSNSQCLLFALPFAPSSSRRPGVTNETTKKGD